MSQKIRKKEKYIDSDKDGLSDWEEVHLYGTDPNNPDTDGDGMSDGDEVRVGRNPNGRGSLKDIFIPHEGNDYQPYSLHPKRILFHGLSAVAVKLVVVVFVLAYPMTAWLTPDVTTEQSKKIIALTNDLRKSLSLPLLAESNKLNQAAYAKVQDMFVGQYFAHVSPKDKDLRSFLKTVKYEYLAAGENLAMGYDEAGDVVQAWKDSPTHYANLVDEDFKEIGVSLAVDIFEDDNVVLAAQYFGQPRNTEPTLATTPSRNIKKTVVKKTETQAVLASREVHTPDVKVTIDQPVAKKESLIMVQATLPVETKEATAEVLQQDIVLSQNETGEWKGTAMADTSIANQPIVPSTITTADSEGNQETTDIASQVIRSQKTSLVDQYFLLKNNSNSAIQKIFDISSSYFKFVLILAIISLLLNIFIQIKKQHPHLIASGFGLVFLLLIFIIF